MKVNFEDIAVTGAGVAFGLLLYSVASNLGLTGAVNGGATKVRALIGG